MLRHGLGLLHKRNPQTSDGIDNLPSSIGNPTATLPASIAATGVSPDPSSTAPIVTASAPSGLTTITQTETLAESITSLNTVSTITTERVRIITDPLEYASITSAAARSSSTKVQATTSQASASATATTSAAAAAAKSTSNLNTLVPAIVVPVVVVLLASLGVFWFFMRKRHQKELESQPEFVMTGKGEKLSSRSNSARSTASNGRSIEKLSPVIAQKELPAVQSPPNVTSEWPSGQIGVAQTFAPSSQDNTAPRRTYNPPFSSQPRSGPSSAAQSRPYKNFNGPVPRPATSGRPAPPPSNRDPTSYRNRSNSTPGQRGLPPPPRTDSARPQAGLPSNPNPNPNVSAPSAAFRLRDPSPRMNHNARAQAPGRLEAAPPGAYNGASPISQYSPIVKDTPDRPRGAGAKRGPPAAINTSSRAENKNMSNPPHSASPQGTPLTEENVRIARLANSSRLAYTPAEPSPSPKLPPPATRSQLIPRDSMREDQDSFFGGSINDSDRLRGGQPQNPFVSEPGPSWVSSRHASLVSEPDDYEDIEAKSEVSSLNEFERFDFGPDVGSRSGSAAGSGSMSYFASQNNGGGGTRSPFGNSTTHERW